MKKSWLFLLVVAAAAGAGAYYYWQQQGVASRLDIQTAEVKRADVRRVVATSGTVSALVTVDIGSQLSGNIGAVNVDYSTEVKQGQVLARIEPSSFETRVREEEAGVAVARANVDLQQAGVERAEANLHKAELDLGRAKELVTKGATSQAALDTAVAAEQSAAADLAIAKANVENAKATLTQHEATLDSARIDLDRTYIRSPIDGVVIDKIVEVGQTVAASLQAPKLFTIAQDLNQVQIQAQVDEADIGQVTGGNPVSFTVDAYPEAKFQGTVQQIRLAPVSLQNVVTYTVVIGAENALGRLLPGMTANVEIITGEHSNVVTVPNDALRFQPHGPAEALVRDTTASGSTQTASSGAGDRTGRMLDKLKDDLQLTPEEVDKVRAGVEAEFTTLKNAAPPGAGPSQDDAREQARMRIAKVLRVVLTPDQFKKYQELQRARPGALRSGTVWIYDAGGLLPCQVRLGLSDANATEVVDGLDPGAHVVLSAREIEQ
jgi:HlyD family secretion protein